MSDDSAVFTLTQALQLVGLAPCLFVMVFLLTLVWSNRQAVVPILYFLSLACSFALPLLAIYPAAQADMWVQGGLLLGESLLIAFSFLLICQFIMGHVPHWRYWLVLTIPLIGGGMILYAGVLQGTESCKEESCLDVDSVKTLYHIFSSALMFLLLVSYFSRFSRVAGEQGQKRHKYWLIIALVLLHLLLLALDLLRLSGHVSLPEVELSGTVLRLTFIYLVLTSLFRVFYPNLVREVIMVAHAPAYNPALDTPQVERIKALLEQEKIYREMRLTRAAFAEKLAISEHQLSRIINHYFDKNFNDLLNGYRIEEAKTRLLGEPGQQITIIGFEVGFNSIASFNRVFKDKVGMSPTEFRARKKGDGE